MGKKSKLKRIRAENSETFIETNGDELRKTLEFPTLGTSAAVLIYATTLLITYGFLVFSYALSVDEEMYALSDPVGTAMAWMSQTRWAMGFTAFLIPSVIGPAVSVGCGIALFALSVWKIALDILKLRGWALLLSASFSATYPVMVFAFDFDTIAFGLGLGFVAVWLCLKFLQRDGLSNKLLAAAFFAITVSTYESLSVAVLLMVATLVFLHPSANLVKEATKVAVIGFVSSKVIAFALIFILQLRIDPYIGSYFQISQLIQRPFERLNFAITDMSNLYSFSASRFGLSNFWGQALVMTLFIAVIVATLIKLKKRGTVLRIIAVFLIITLPMLLQSLNEWPLPLRVFIFLPAQALGLFAILFSVRPLRRQWLQYGAGVLIVAITSLAVVGNASQTNRIAATSRTTYALDQAVAYDIFKAKEQEIPGRSLVEVPFRMMGKISRASTKMKPVLPAEAVGVSLFGFAPGETFRVTNFLNTQGVLFTPDSSDNSLMDAELRNMPNYPSPGWAKNYQGTLLVKFSD